ncbi:MAG: DUF2436 domain-containing protein [Muribaculaceae bacterium]|nr:DUF2436 domain-containing protein [Muribaculaceae bacterium]
MTRILRFLLIAVIALPLWQPIAAQKAIGGDEPVMAEMNDALMHPLKARFDTEPTIVHPRGTVPEGFAKVTLAVGIRWVDGYGYQMLLDKDHTAYTFRLSNYSNQLGGYLTTANYGSINNYNNYNRATYGSTFLNNFYNEFEYKIPTGANAAQGTQNVILDEPGSVLIPAGTYDFAITVPATYLLMASNHGQIQRSEWDDFEFESGKSYVFNVLGVQENGTAYDAVYLEISAPYMALLGGDGAFGDVQIGEAKTVTITVMNTGEDAFTPVINCDNPAFTISSTSSGPIASGASRSYVVTFAPTELQSYTGTFTLTAQEVDEMDFKYTTPLSGTGVGDGHQGDPSGGNNQSSMFPVYGEYFTTQGTTSQMIYPASMLTAQGIKAGDAITALTFYVQGNGTVPTQLGNATVTMRLGNTTATTVTSQSGMETNRTNSTQVFSGNLTTGANTLTINLSAPYQYLGDNLIVDFVVGSSNTSQSCSWVGENNHSNASYCTYYRYWTRTSQGSFLPKISIGYSTMPELEATTSIDFGTVSIGDGNAQTAIVKNESNVDVEATISVSPNPPFSVASNAITIGANSFAIIPVTFMPNAEADFTGTVTIVAGNETINIPLTGKGIYSGPEATRDKAFFDGITYRWPINVDEEDQTESTLSEIATDPEQIIAMLREIYTNKNIPGNYYRGHTATGGKDHDNEVPYTGVGMITSNSSSVCEDSYGWDIPGDVLPGGNYRYMDPEQYKPNEEGVTLLLIEMVDNFKKPSNITKATTTYEELKDYIGMSIKSARVITDARRTGEGIKRGTLFKIDCDKMNKFYLIAKGQLLWFDNLRSTISYSNPAYYNGSYSDEGLAFDYLNGPALLCHMFEQFSPTVGNAEAASADLYWDLIDMESFGVIHDCPNVPFVQNGHHFMMYGEDSDPHDCQDVRDMMFFVPDFRMLEHLNRGSGGLSENRSQDYFRYNTKYQPTMGMFVIHQNDIPEGSVVNPDYSDPNNSEVTGLYKHQLSWKSNLDDFLPSYMQEYELWELVVDEFGVESYVPVYYRNANGEYTDAAGNVVSTPVPIILHRQNLSEFTYPDVYVDMHQGSQTKTYVIRGRDAADADGKYFLSLQMSNMEEIIIPGTDPNEKARMIAATFYSRFNPDNEKNCYSNKLEMNNNGVTLTASDLNNTLNFYRSSRAAQVDDDGNVITDENGNIQYATTATKTLIATGTATPGNNGGTITITLVDGTQSPKTDYPDGHLSGTGAGYHANSNLTYNYTINNGVVNFTNFAFWDNFTVDVSKNAHPLQYLYKMEVGSAYSNEVRVPVYKTDSKINSYTYSQVEADTVGNLELEDVEFQAKVQLSSKTEILRYDAYRWEAGLTRYIIESIDDNGDEEDIDPTGMAGNQGDWYTVTMNKVQEPEYYYVASTEDQPAVSTSNPTNWAKFVDYYPRKVEEAEGYIYAPVVELFTRGYKEVLDNEDNKVARDDYNTYGGPLKSAAAGVVDLEVPGYGISGYSWLKGSDRYAYYNVDLRIKQDDVPNGYDIYRVRAWRVVDDINLLDEPLEQFAGRKTTKYLFEDLKGQAYDGDYQPGQHMVLGTTLIQDVQDNSGNTISVYNGTFGARKVETSGQNDANDGCVEKLEMKFIVRVYFTPTTSRAGAPRLRADDDDEPQVQDTKPYYIAEYEFPFTINSGIPTGVEMLNANRQVVGTKYYNVAGIESDTPFQGVNIVVTRYNDGSTTTTKIIK